MWASQLLCKTLRLMRLTPALKQRLLVFSLLLCGVTAQEWQKGSTSAGAAALTQQRHADSDGVAELIDWIVAAGGEARPRKPIAWHAWSSCLPQEDRQATVVYFLMKRARMQVHASVVHLPGGLRGLRTNKDIAEGELAFAVPASLAVPLGDYLLHSAVRCNPQVPAGPASLSITCRRGFTLRLRN